MRAAWLAVILVLLGGEPAPIEHLGRFGDPAIREASGIVASRKHPGVFWVHNDSGNAPVLFAIRRDGSLVRKYQVAATNIDWEDITTDNDGQLFIGDIGNNGNLLPMRTIYRVDEPDPSQNADGPLRVTLSSRYAFPPRSRFDAEGLFLLDGRAVVVAKTFDGREAELYAIALDPPGTRTKPVLPERIGSLPGFKEPATGASLTADGKRLAVCALKVARVYQRDGAAFRLLGEVQYEASGIEAVCWDGPDLIIAGEGGDLYRIRENQWRASPRALDGTP